MPTEADETRSARRRRGATINDVASRAGVAASTVSRALSNPQRVNHVTRQRIEQAAAELDYVPSAGARSLSSGRFQTLALLVPDISNPFFFDLIRGAQRQARAAGYTQLLVDTEESADIESATLSQMVGSADGVILAAPRISDATIAEAAERQPLVVVNRDIDGVPGVIIDTAAGAAQALTHLRSLGHTTIAYLAGPTHSWSSRMRWEALVAAAAGTDVELINLGPNAPNARAGAAAADTVLTTPATACIAFNDLLAIGMLGRLAERGVRVPEELSVVGCDDIFGADFCSPPLTSIAAPIEEAGRAAVSLLLTGLGRRSRPRMRTVLPTYLRTRASSSTAPVATL
ncbi:LacI family DNA-binding transcriptional regulator [Microbacterium gorillae]|uniref:LacI family DNA-binding transcriptional regulator n=1 Tax=Microbacterium gorillae TaxID=1231063 RepID=UPI00058D829C|nr:LacI family DNA-binding transcriptional regulator [Microbacterium gorillae]